VQRAIMFFQMPYSDEYDMPCVRANVRRQHPHDFVLPFLTL
jgi:hypothetical protein